MIEAPPFGITVCGIEELEGHCATGASHVLSILDPDHPVPEAFGTFGEHEKLELRFDDIIDDGPGKPVGINEFIGRRPILAFGNSDGDLQMLEWTAADSGPRLMLLVHHTDATREYAYDRQSSVGKLDKALDEATKNGWVVVSMKDDWKRIFAFDAA